MRLVAAALVVFALSAAPASGSWSLPPRAPVTAQTLLDRYLPIARAAWPGSPCEGQERVTLSDDAEINAFTAADPDRYPGGATGLAFTAHGTDPLSPDYCRVALGTEAAVDPGLFCVVLTHELGHLAGYGHSDNPTDVMSREHPTYGPCATPTRASLDDLVRAGLPRADAWRFSCAVVRAGAVKCRASAPFARRARYVLVHPDLASQQSEPR